MLSHLGCYLSTYSQSELWLGLNYVNHQLIPFNTYHVLTDKHLALLRQENRTSFPDTPDHLKGHTTRAIWTGMPSSTMLPSSLLLPEPFCRGHQQGHCSCIASCARFYTIFTSARLRFESGRLSDIADSQHILCAAISCIQRLCIYSGLLSAHPTECLIWEPRERYGRRCSAFDCR